MSNKFISVLDKIGEIGKDIWKVAVPVLETTEKVVNAIEPEIAAVVPAFGPIWNITETLVKTAEAGAAGAGANAAGKQKLAFVLAALTPYAVQESQRLGILPPTTAQLTAWVNLVVAGLKTFGSLP